MTELGILLAAGRSRRFGDANKLLTMFRGQPLVAHAAAALQASGVDECIAVVSEDAVAACLGHLGFEPVWVEDDDAAMSLSVRTGIACALAREADGALVALGDMPMVSGALMASVRARGHQHGVSALTDGTRRTPPAWFSSHHYVRLMALAGDAGAGALLRTAPRVAMVEVRAETLVDVDTVADIDRLNHWIDRARR